MEAFYNQISSCQWSFKHLSFFKVPVSQLWLVWLDKPLLYYICTCYVGVSKNNGTPKSSILIGFSIINHPFWGKNLIFGNTHMLCTKGCFLVKIHVGLQHGVPHLQQTLCWSWPQSSHSLAVDLRKSVDFVENHGPPPKKRKHMET